METIATVAPYLRFCGICWGRDQKIHYCALDMGHEGDFHRCHCGEEYPIRKGEPQ